MSISDVIERSRQPGEFSERRQFTIAKDRAITKMRQFALADPAFYILEWIQAAIANGATYLDMQVEGQTSTMSYVGGGFSPGELHELFEFLFASKDDLEVADIRQLALGVNALLLSHPDSIVIESGDGTLEGTTRVEIYDRTNTVVVGTPTAALEGTFVRATGVRRGFGYPRELEVIEERCLTAPIPLLVNGNAIFGYTSVRSPDLVGYRSRLKFDEGDLYGTLGLATTAASRNVKLLTWGVWVSSDRAPWEGLPPIGGVVGYDRLRKTADHANVVRDDVYASLWARLEPYARQLAEGATGNAVFDVRRLDGTPVSPTEFQREVAEWSRTVLFSGRRRGPGEPLLGAEDSALAAQFGEVLDAPVFVVGDRSRESLRRLAGGGVEFITPELNPKDLEFFQKGKAGAPPRPWLASAQEVVLTSDAPRDDDPGSGPSIRWLIGESDSVKATIYTPAAGPPGGKTVVQICVSERVLTEVDVPSDFPGHAIRLEFSDTKRRDALVRDAKRLAEVVVQHLRPRLEAIASEIVRAARGPEEAFSSSLRSIALGVLSRSTMVRLRTLDAEGNCGPTIAIWDDRVPVSARSLPLIDMHDGQIATLDGLQRMLTDNGGVLYVAPPGEYEGPHPDRVIAANTSELRLLTKIVGPAAIVDVAHGRRPLATAGGARLYDVEPGGEPIGELFGRAGWTAATIDELISEMLSGGAEGGRTAGARRRLAEYCAWFAGEDEPDTIDIRAVPLFGLACGGEISWNDVAGSTRPMMLDGWATETASWRPWGASVSEGLALDPFLASRLVPVRPALDYDLSETEARSNPWTPSTAYLESRDLPAPLDGRVGFPHQVGQPTGVLVMFTDRGQCVRLPGNGGGVPGLVGSIRVEGPPPSLDTLTDACAAEGVSMLLNLIQQLPSTPVGSPRHERILEILLQFAGTNLVISRVPSGSLVHSTLHPTAAKILELPIFPTTAGISVSAASLLREFGTYGDRGHQTGRTRLTDDVSPVLVRWLDGVLDVEPMKLQQFDPERRWSSPGEWLSDALNRLRPESDTTTWTVTIVGRDQIRAAMSWGNETAVSTDLMLTGDSISVAEDFWLLRHVFGDEPTFDERGAPRQDPERTAWLLMSLYAYVNEQRLAVTNINELEFQSRVLQWVSEVGSGQG